MDSRGRLSPHEYLRESTAGWFFPHEYLRWHLCKLISSC